MTNSEDNQHYLQNHNKTKIFTNIKCVSFSQFVKEVVDIHFHKNVEHSNNMDEF